MDPLSVTASIIAVVTAAATIIKQLEDLRARSKPHVELMAIMNLVTDLHATLTIIQGCGEDLQKNNSLAVQKCYEGLPRTLKNAELSLDRLTDFAWEKILRKGKGMGRFGLSEKSRRQLSEIKEAISDSHRSLQLMLLSTNIRQTNVLLSTIQEVTIVCKDHSVQYPTSLEQAVTETTTVRFPQGHVGNSRPIASPGLENRISLEEDSQIRSNLEPVESTSSQIRITTTIPRRNCNATCNCQCHVRTQFRTPPWLSAMVGTLFYSSSYTPSPETRPCNSRLCSRSQPYSSSRFTYYFPAWMMRSTLLHATWNNLEGRNSSWMIKMPREISGLDYCWDYIYVGSVDLVRESLSQRTMTPFDIDRNGQSVLHYALIQSEYDVCKTLVTAGADWHLKDRFGCSALDKAWDYALRSPVDYEILRKHNLIGSEIPEDLCLTALHHIVLGLSSADLETQLELDSSMINEPDWLGKTPLMWAALRNDERALQLLLDYGAKLDTWDIHMKTATHLAAESGSFDCVESLLEAGANPNASDVYGNTPLHLLIDEGIAKNSSIKQCIFAFQRHKANIDALDANGITPLGESLFNRSEGAEALLQCGADINFISSDNSTIISQAIYYNNPDVVQIICQGKPKSFWTRPNGTQDSIIEWIAEYGAAETMGIIADSDLDPVECDFSKMRFWFRNRRRHIIYGRRLSPEEELAAFENLLEKKGIDTATEISDDEYSSSEEDDYSDDQCSSDERADDQIEDSDDADEGQDFEDAVEDLSLIT